MMNKTELISAIVQETESSKLEATQFVNALVAICVDSLKRGETVQLPNFGTLSLVERSARMGINPRTKQEMQIPASKNVKFKAGKALKDALKDDVSHFASTD